MGKDIKDEEKLKEQQTPQTAEQTEEADGKPESAEQAQSDASDNKTAELEKALAAEKEKLLRTAAEYANFRTRTEREKAAIYANAVSDTVGEIIPIADNIDRALSEGGFVGSS